jgi:hypothetical protein
MLREHSMSSRDRRRGRGIGFGRAGEEAVEAGRGLGAHENRDGVQRPDQDRGAGQTAEAAGLDAVASGRADR